MTAIPLTFTYKTADNVDFKVDVHLPDESKFGLKSGYAKALPVLIHWHGGGLVFGTRVVETCPTHPTWLTGQLHSYTKYSTLRDETFRSCDRCGLCIRLS